MGTIGKETLVFSRIISSKDKVDLERPRPQCEASQHGRKEELEVGERRKPLPATAFQKMSQVPS